MSSIEAFQPYNEYSVIDDVVSAILAGRNPETADFESEEEFVRFIAESVESRSYVLSDKILEYIEHRVRVLFDSWNNDSY